MKNRIFRKTPLAALTLLLIVTMTVLPVFAAVSVPKYTEYYIADDAGLLSEGTVHNVAKNNQTLFDKNGTSIGICTVKDIGDEAIGDFARRVYENWKMVEGVLIVVVGEESADPRLNNYHLIQSTGVEDTITNETLEAIRADYMEADFAAGNIDRAVYSAATKLTTMLSEIEDPDAPAAGTAEEENDETSEKDEDKKSEGTTAGGIIVGFLKFVLITALILIALFIILFAVAMFNDDAAELMQKYVFQRGKTSSVPSDFYDERLYGTNHQIQQRGRQNAQRAQQNRQQYPQNRAYGQQQYRQNALPPARQMNQPRPSNQARQYNPNYQTNQARQYNQQQYGGYQSQNGYAQQNGYPQQRPVMYNADGTVRRPRQNNGNPQQNRQQNPGANQNYNGQVRRAPQQNCQPADDGATRMFSLPLDSNNN